MLFPQFQSTIYLNNFLDSFFDAVFDTSKEIENFVNVYNIKYPSYPVCNTGVTDDGFFCEMALTGFNKSDIKISIEDLVLSIEAKAPEKIKKVEYFHKGLSQKDVQFSYKLSDKLNLETISTSYENGLLTIEIPLKEEAKPVKKIVELK